MGREVAPDHPGGSVGLRSQDDLGSQPVCLSSTSVCLQVFYSSTLLCLALPSFHISRMVRSATFYNTIQNTEHQWDSPEGTALQKRHKPETLHLCFPPSPACSLRGKRESSARGWVCSVHSTVTSSLDGHWTPGSGEKCWQEERLGCLASDSSLPKSIVWLSGFHGSSLRV